MKPNMAESIEKANKKRTLRTLTVITPCFNEEESIELCVNEVRRVMAESCPEVKYDHLIVDNASQDRTVSILEDIAESDARVKVLVNSRNVGASRSMLNALKYCSSQACIPFLPADLQDPPSLIPKMIEFWEAGFDRVYGVRRNRQESRLLRLSRHLYYKVLRKFADAEVPHGAGEFQLLDRNVFQQIAQVDDHYPFVRGLIAMTGGMSIGVPYNWEKRQFGKSKASFAHLLDLGLNGILSTSRFPARMIFAIGVMCSMLGFGYIGGVGLLTLVNGSSASPGINTLLVALFFFSGVQLISIAVVGEYVTAIHSQVRRGPRMYIARSMNFDSKTSTNEVDGGPVSEF